MTLAGTEQYMAPEGWCSPPDRAVCLSYSLHTNPHPHPNPVILGEDYGDKCDVFGYVVIPIENTH